jgi:outer membrane immunogenic protein
VRTRIFALIAAGLLGAAPSLAGEPGSFGGAYIGLNAGAAWGSANYATDPGCLADPAGDAAFCNAGTANAINGTAVAASGSGDLSSSGFTGGIQGGYNWQFGSVVLGGEGDFGAFDLGESSGTSGNFPFAFAGTSYVLQESMSTNWLMTLRGRVGYTVQPNLLLYATGGLALTDFSFSSSYSDNANNGIVFGGVGYGKSSDVRAGGVVGGGGEWLFDRNWSFKAEYLYINFGSMDVTVPVVNGNFAQTMTVDADLSASVARVGVNYRP